jgi:hypothetical protein
VLCRAQGFLLPASLQSLQPLLISYARALLPIAQRSGFEIGRFYGIDFDKIVPGAQPIAIMRRTFNREAWSNKYDGSESKLRFILFGRFVLR